MQVLNWSEKEKKEKDEADWEGTFRINERQHDKMLPVVDLFWVLGDFIVVCLFLLFWFYFCFVFFFVFFFGFFFFRVETIISFEKL